MPAYKDENVEVGTVNSIMRIGQENVRKNIKEASGQKKKHRIMKMSLNVWRMLIWI